MAHRIRLRAVDDEQRRAAGVDPSLGEVAQQRGAALAVLGGALRDPEDVFGPGLVEAQGDEHDVVGDIDAVDHEYAFGQPRRDRQADPGYVGWA